MLTRLKVNGFKNLMGVDISFGPFTCIAGVNGVGKSNLFDAITFLGALAEKRLIDAALSVRSEGARASDLRSIFYRAGDRYVDEMTFEAEMLVPEEGVDDLGQEARAAITFLSYSLALGMEGSALTVRREELTHITLGEAGAHLRFPHRVDWRRSVVKGRRASPFISTSVKDGVTYIRLHQDLGKGYKGGGRPHVYVATRLPRTVLSEANSADSATAVLARREMQSWRLLQLEPSGLRKEDDFLAPRSLAMNGAHLPATLARLTHVNTYTGAGPRAGGHPSEIHEPPAPYGSEETAPAAEESEVEDAAAAVYARVANRLAELIDGVQSVRLDVDERRELLTLMLTERDGTEHEARSLSDGTLRFLALAVLESDSQARGVLCMEEPENGIHPQRMPAMLRLLRDLAVDPTLPVDGDNALRQVIVNTHSPIFAAQVDEDSLLVALPEAARVEDHWGTIATFRWLPGTWRATAHPELPTVPLGEVVSYLNPLGYAAMPLADEEPAKRSRRRPGEPSRVLDREDLQLLLPLPRPSQAS